MSRLQVLLLACSLGVALTAFGQFATQRPAEAFEQDTHYYITAWLADTMCFTWDEAYVIASGNISQDSDEKLVAHSKLFGPFYGARGWKTNTMADWHAFGPAAGVRLAALEARWLALWNQGGAENEQKALVELGQMLHFAQDRFSHARYGFILGHAIDTLKGDDPDSLAKDAAKSRDMIKDTLKKLDAACVAIGRAPDPTAQQVWAQQQFQNTVTQLIDNSRDDWKSIVTSIFGFFRRLIGRQSVYDQVIAKNIAVVEAKAGRTFQEAGKIDHTPAGEPIGDIPKKPQDDIDPGGAGPSPASNLELSLIAESVVPPFYHPTIRVSNIGDAASPSGELHVAAFVVPNHTPVQEQTKAFNALSAGLFVDIVLDPIPLSSIKSTLILMVEVPSDSGGLDGDARDNDLTILLSKSVEEPPATGNFSGIADILVHLDDKNLQAFYCKARTDHDPLTNDVKTAVTCFSDTPGQAAPGNKVPTNPDIDLLGPPPPPPYGNGAPQKGEGSYNPGTDTLTTTTCFESLGGTLGPNVISTVVIPNAKASLPNQSGTVDIYFGQGIEACKELTPVGDPTQSLPLNIDTYDTPPYDNITSVDSDGDGCPDAFELDKNRSKKDCGKDPWNPHDSDLNFSGTFTITVEVIRADTCDGSGGPVAGPPPIGCTGAAQGDILSGSYFNCQAVLDHNKGTNQITGKAFCYTDNAVTTVNLEVSGAIVCAPFPSANPDDCGDGLPGSPPPGPFGDNDGVTTPGVITGFYDKEANEIELDACFEGIANPAIGPFAYAQIEVNAHTMLGTVDIWLRQQSCVKPTSEPGSKAVGVALGEQDDDYDVDQDGCTTAEELGTNQFKGGQRDPYNKYDHMDINKDGFINVPDDILGTAALFGPSTKGAQGNVGPRLAGSVPWAHGNGDIAINIPDDILGTAAQFGHNCDGDATN